MNLAISKSDATYCWFLNCGDEIIVENFHNFVEYLNSCQSTWLICGGSFTWRDDQILSNDNLRNFLTLKENSFISHQTVITKTSELIRLSGFDIRYKVAADTDLLARMYLREEPDWYKAKVVKVEEPKFASDHNKRARYETLVLSIRLLNSRMIFRVILREMVVLLERCSGDKEKYP